MIRRGVHKSVQALELIPAWIEHGNQIPAIRLDQDPRRDPGLTGQDRARISGAGY